MAGNLPLTNGVQLKLVWATANEPRALNLLAAFNSAGTAHTQARADQIDAAVKSALTTSALAGQLSTFFSLLRVESRSMTANTDPWFLGTGAPVAGTAAGNLLPPATALVVSLRTGLRGRSYNGRVYLTGFTEDANDEGGVASPAAQTAAASFITALRTAIATAPLSLTLGVVSRFTTIPPATTAIERNPPIITPVTGNPVRDGQWDTQRRRSKPGI